jgi:hypothetical protein
MGTLGFGYLGTESGIAFDSSGNIGYYTTDSGGLGAGLDASATVHLGITPSLDNISQLRGAGNNVGFSAGDVVAVGADVTTASDGTVTYGYSLGVGAGASVQAGRSYTYPVTSFGSARASK